MRFESEKLESNNGWPERPVQFPLLMTPVEAAQFLRLDQTTHTPESAKRMLNYWRDRGELRATKFVRRVWYLKDELEDSGLITYKTSIIIRKAKNLSQ